MLIFKKGEKARVRRRKRKKKKAESKVQMTDEKRQEKIVKEKRGKNLLQLRVVEGRKE